MNKRCVILSGGPIFDYSKIKPMILPTDYIIAADRGLHHAACMGITPHLAVGDFDSHQTPDIKIDTVQLPCEKDDTDTYYAVKEALSRGYRDILILGATGGRSDHMLANLYTLLYIKQKGAVGTMADEYCLITPVCGTATVNGDYPYFSLVTVAGQAKGVTITGAKYPLQDGIIDPCYQYGVSNQVLPGQTAHIKVESGEVLLILSRD